MFHNRADAGFQLAQRLRRRRLINPLVLGIPRGGVVTGAAIAQVLKAELDVVLTRKLRAPGQPELALGAICELGQMYLNIPEEEITPEMKAYLEEEKQHQLKEIKRRKKLFRAVRPPAVVEGRTVIVTDDGIATGATMIASLQVVQAQHAREVLVAVPVASPPRLAEVRRWCDETICLLAPEEFWAVGQFYEDFTQVEDETVLALLRDYGVPSPRDLAEGAKASPLKEATQR